MTRQTEILRWLASSPLAIPLRHGRGFFVLRGPRVRLTDGMLLDALDWLQAEGFGAGLALEGYHVTAINLVKSRFFSVAYDD